MRFLNGLGAALVLAVTIPVFGVAGATTVYIAQAAAGSANGSSCANALAVTFFNNAGNWGSGAGQIGPGTVVYLCGTITSGLQIHGSGASGNVIEVLWTPGARISVPHGPSISLNGGNGYLLFDGGTACGPGTSCDTVEAANLTGYASGQAGIIEATANGSALANQDVTTQGITGCNACHDIEMRNLIIRNLYVHSSPADTTNSADVSTYSFQCPGGNSGCASGTISIHDSTLHDLGNGVSIEITSATTVDIYNNDFYRMNWATELSGSGTRTFSFHDNLCHDTANWDTASDAFHHNCVHVYMSNTTDSLLTAFYNNYSYGNWGTCCTTATLMYAEDAHIDNLQIFNNLDIQACDGETAPALEVGGTNARAFNNTLIGCPSAGSNSEAIVMYGPGWTFENNAIQGYGQYVVLQTGSTPFAVADYNQYGPGGMSGNNPFVYGSVNTSSFSAWQSDCSCDSHGANPASLTVNSFGVPQTGSTLIGAGANLTSLGISALDSATSAGDTVASVARPASGAWVAGAYPYSTSTGPNPPTALTLVTQ